MLSKIWRIVRIPLYILNVIVIGCVCYAVWFVIDIFDPLTGSDYRVRKFDQSVWFEQERKYHPEPGVYGGLDCTRGNMYEDLHHNHLQSYMHISKIEWLLGHSTVARTYPESWLFDHCFKCFQYEMGSCFNGPSVLLRFCAVRGINYYTHKLVTGNDDGIRIFEDAEEHHKKYLELKQFNDEATRLRHEREKQQKLEQEEKNHAIQQ